MINWFWKYHTLVRRLPVLIALMAGFMFAAGPYLAYSGGALKAFPKSAKQELLKQEQSSGTGEEIPHFEPVYTALAQVAPLQLFFYQPAVLPVILPQVEIVEQAGALVPDLVNSYHRTLFRRIISPNAP